MVKGKTLSFTTLLFLLQSSPHSYAAYASHMEGKQAQVMTEQLFHQSLSVCSSWAGAVAGSWSSLLRLPEGSSHSRADQTVGTAVVPGTQEPCGCPPWAMASLPFSSCKLILLILNHFSQW